MVERYTGRPTAQPDKYVIETTGESRSVFLPSLGSRIGDVYHLTALCTSNPLWYCITVSQTKGTMPTAVMQRPTWEASCDAGKFFIDVEDEEGNVGKMMMRIIRAAVIVTTAFGDKVAFTTSNRSRKSFLDSRMSQRKERKDAWDNKTTVKVRQRLNSDQLMSELERLLDDKWEAQQAFYALQV